MTKKQRQWVTEDEMQRVKELLHIELGAKSSVLIEISRVLPLLIKQEATRLIWCRTARAQITRWGIKLGVRNRQNSYKVQVVDAQRWEAARTGLLKCDDHTQDDTAIDPAPPKVDLSYLIPARNPAYVLPDWADHLRTSLAHGHKVLLTGPAGSGKTSLVRELAARERKPFLRVNLTTETTASDLLGSMRVKGREMYFQYGPVALAVQGGGWLCLDEFDCASASLMCLQAVLEPFGVLHIPDTNEWIRPHKDFRLIATANSVGRGGDDSQLYLRQLIDEATLDRLNAVYQVDYMPRHLEHKVISGTVGGLDARTIDRMLMVAQELRKALLEGIINASFSTRKLLSWAEQTAQLNSVSIAAQYAVLNKLTADDRRVVREVLQRHGIGVAQ